MTVKPTQHTPGPWVTVRDNSVRLTIGGVAGGSARIVWSEHPDSGTDVAYVLPHADGDNGNANARLIAAAPELADRLGSSTRTLVAAPDIPDDWPSDDAIEAFHAAYGAWREDRDRELVANRAAIAKAVKS